MKTVVTTPAAQAIGSTKQLQAQAVLAFTEFHQLARRTVEQAWECGRLLTELKETMEHGTWLPWLEENDISRRTASHFMRLHHAYPQMGKLGVFGSVDAALKALPKPSNPEGDANEPKPLTAQEKWLVERDDLVKENPERALRPRGAGEHLRDGLHSVLVSTAGATPPDARQHRGPQAHPPAHQPLWHVLR